MCNEVCWTLDQIHRVQALARDIVLGQDTYLTVSLFCQVYKWAQVNLMLGLTLQWTSISYGGGSKCTPNQFMLQKL